MSAQIDRRRRADASCRSRPRRAAPSMIAKDLARLLGDAGRRPPCRRPGRRDRSCRRARRPRDMRGPDADALDAHALSLSDHGQARRRAEEVALADVDAGVAQEVVGRRQMEIIVRHAEVQRDSRRPFILAFMFGPMGKTISRSAPASIAGVVDRGDEGERLLDARLQLVDASSRCPRSAAPRRRRGGRRRSWRGRRRCAPGAGKAACWGAGAASHRRRGRIWPARRARPPWSRTPRKAVRVAWKTPTLAWWRERGNGCLRGGRGSPGPCKWHGSGGEYNLGGRQKSLRPAPRRRLCFAATFA